MIGEQLVLEGATGRLPGGRRPTFLLLNESRVVICVDIRPVRITLGVADINSVFSAQESTPTPRRPQAAIREIAARIERLVKGRPKWTIEGIGISVPCRIHLPTQRLVFAPNLKWRRPT